MNYTESINYLEQSMKFGSILGLSRMNALMEMLGNPGKNLKYIHVAGTNGKGSVTTMIANSLSAGAFRTGVYTSPFVERFSERIRIIDGKEGFERLIRDSAEGEISKDDFAIHMTRVKECIDKMTAQKMEHPTEFEIITAVAFMHYELYKCDYVVLETGLGGRLDSTNVIENPIKCVITAIGYDHMDRLGNTIEEITSEKAGIIKPDSEVIIYDPCSYTKKEEATKILDIFINKCKQQNVRKITLISKECIKLKSYTLEGQKFKLKIKSEKPMDPEISIEIFTPLLGIYQPMNCAVAIECVKDLVTLKDIRYAISKTKWPARMELLRNKNPIAFLDGGHNAQGANALRKTLEKLQKDKDIVLFCGVMSDKDYKKMLITLLSSTKYKIIAVFCTKPNNVRAQKSEILANSVVEILDNLPLSSYNRLAKVFYNDDVKKLTFDAILYTSNANAAFVAFGSLYMAGDIRKIILDECLQEDL